EQQAQTGDELVEHRRVQGRLPGDRDPADEVVRAERADGDAKTDQERAADARPAQGPASVGASRGDARPDATHDATAPAGSAPLCSTTTPSRSSILSSAPRASSRSWVTMITVRPSAATSRKASSTCRPLRESRLPVGSSANTTCGSLASALANATRCR